jgi:hypothetical protein
MTVGPPSRSRARRPEASRITGNTARTSVALFEKQVEEHAIRADSTENSRRRLLSYLRCIIFLLLCRDWSGSHPLSCLDDPGDSVRCESLDQMAGLVLAHSYP